MVTCPGCSTQAFLECSCPDGFLDAVGAHHGDCSHADIDASLICPPGSACCTQNHDHAAAANACPGGHDGAACPDASTCRVWRGGAPDVLHPQFDPATGVPPCPGGHCHKDIPDCGVCRPLVITMLPGTQITPVGR
jgi:hypothetical protein